MVYNRKFPIDGITNRYLVLNRPAVDDQYRLWGRSWTTATVPVQLFIYTNTLSPLTGTACIALVLEGTRV